VVDVKDANALLVQMKSRYIELGSECRDFIHSFTGRIQKGHSHCPRIALKTVPPL
jgi:hypothetical protein